MPACYCSTMSLAVKRSFIPGLTPTQVVPVSSRIPFLAFVWSHTGIWFLQKFFLVLTNAFGIIFLRWTFLIGYYFIVLDIIFLQWTLFYCISHNFLALIIIFVHWTLFSCIEYYFLALDIIFLHWTLFYFIGYYFHALDIIFL